MKRRDMRIRIRRLAGAMLLAWTVATAQAGEPTGTSSTATSSGIGLVADKKADVAHVLRAMLDADVSALTELYRSSDPTVHLWAAMALERVHFNLDAATADARICEQALFDSKPAMALACGQFESGDLRLAGRFKEARDLENTLIERYRGHGVDRQLDSMRTYQASTAGVPDPVVQPPVEDVTVPYKDAAHQNQPRPVIAAEAHGRTFDLLIDTGASYLTLGQDEARRLGVKLLDKKDLTNGMLSKGIPVQHGLLDELKIGSLVLRNLPVDITPGANALIGADLIAPLGSLRFGHSSLLIYGSRSAVPVCDSPMRAGSGLWGNSLRLHPELLINGQPHSVLLDTGDSMYLTGSKAALDEVTVLHRGKLAMGDLGGRHPFANARAAKVQVVIAGQPIQMYFPVLADSAVPWPILLGAGALRDMDFLLDFRHQRMCFLLHPDLH